MVSNDELYASFMNLRSADRIDLMVGLLHLCVPLELRFVGSVLEELARKDYARLKELETKANDLDALRETRIDGLSKYACGTVGVYLSLLHSDNAFCATALFDMLVGMKCLVDEAVGRADGGAVLDCAIADDLILLFTMALYHPAFMFSQRTQLQSDYENLKNQLVDFISSIPLKNGSVTEEKGTNSIQNEPDHEDEDEVSESADSTLHDTEVEPAYLKEVTLKSTTTLEGKTEFMFEIIWSDTMITSVTKTYPELSEFHRQFVHQFPSYSGVHKQERLLPFFPQENNDRIVELMKEYFRKFSSLPECCLKCNLVVEFFQDKGCVPSSSSSASSSSSSSSALILVVSVVPVTQTTVTVTPSGSQTNIFSKNCVDSSDSKFTSEQDTGLSEREIDHRGGGGSRIHSLTVYNSKRGTDMAGKPIRPRMTANAKTPIASMNPPFAPVHRHPWIVSQASSVNPLQQSRIYDGSIGSPVVSISPCLSITSVCTSPQPPGISPPQSNTSNSSTELSQSHSSVSETSLKQKRFSRHHDYLSANSCHRAAELDEDQYMQQQQQHSTPLHKSRSEQDHRRILSNGAPPGFATNDDKISAGYGPPQQALNAIETPLGYPMFNPAAASMRAMPWDPLVCYYIPQPMMKPSGMVLPVATQTNTAAKPARPILGASHQRGGTKAHQLENGEKRSAAAMQETSAASGRVAVTTALVTVATQSASVGDGNPELVRHSSPVLVSSESALSRPSSLNVSSMTSRQRPKAANNDAKAGPGSGYAKISSSRSVAAVSTCADTRGTAGYYQDVPATNSTQFPVPGPLMIQRVPAGTQPFSIPTAPPPISSHPAIHNAPTLTSAVPTPSSTPPILPPPPANLTSDGGGPCTSCCQCMRCVSMQALSAIPYTYPFIWQPGHVYPNAYSFINGFINSHNLSFPPPSLPPHVQVGGAFNGINSDMVYNLAPQPQVPAPVPPPAPPHLNLNHPSVMSSNLFTTSQCVPFHPFPPPVYIHNPAGAAKPKQCCPNCGSSDHVLNACTETKASVLSHTAQFRLNPGTKQPSE